MHGGHGHRQLVLERVELQADVGKLVGEQGAFAVVQQGLELEGTGAKVYRVVGGRHLAFGQFFLQVAVPCLNSQGLPSPKFALDQRHMGFGHGKQHRHGLGLRDGDQPGRIARAHQAAQLDLLEAQAPTDGRSDLGVGQLQCRVVHLGLVGLHRAL